MTEQQQLFKAEYLINGFNATQAAITAGYSEKTAYSQGARLLKNVEIRKAIQEHVDSALNAKKAVLRTRIVAELDKLAFSSDDIRDNDKIKALELLGKYDAMFTDKTETTLKTLGNDGEEIGFQFVEAPKKNVTDTEEA